MQQISKTVFWISFLSLLILISGALGYKDIIPFSSIERNITVTAEHIAQIILEKPKAIRNLKYERQGAQLLNEQAYSPGVTALQGWFSDGVAIKLLDSKGELIHRWPINFFEIWPKPVHFERNDHIPKNQYSFLSQGMHLYPDGGLLAVVVQIGLVKMDVCGNVEWTNDSFNHHVVSVDEEGFIWTPSDRRLSDLPDEILFQYYLDPIFSTLKKSRYDNEILKINDKGEIVYKFSVLEKVVEAGIEDRLYDALKITPDDPLHVNDIEFVTETLAKKIPGVEQGDLLISARNMHTLFIMSKDSGDILWHQVGPWVRQHDPDIDGDGNLTIFNNRSKFLSRKGEGAYSNILKFYPETRASEVLYPKGKSMPEKHFYTDIMGTHQILENGNILITESRAGRVFEVSDGGDLVWEYIERYKNNYSALIQAAERYPEDYFQLDNWPKCEG
jgi:hypothetical protein